MLQKLEKFIWKIFSFFFTPECEILCLDDWMNISKFLKIIILNLAGFLTLIEFIKDE